MSSVYPMTGRRMALKEILLYLIPALLLAAVMVSAFRLADEDVPRDKFSNLMADIAHHSSAAAYLPEQA